MISGRCGRHKRRLLALFVALLFSAAGCATSPGTAEEIVYSPDWFRCSSRFQCVVVYDAYCNQTAVNRRFAIPYQDWALQEVERADERLPCPRPDFLNPVAACIAGRCTYPIPIGSRNDEPE